MHLLKSPSATDNSFKNLQGGFSLVEVVLAIGVIAFSIVAILGMLPIALKSATESKKESRAAFIANHLLATLRATTFENARPFESMATGINLSISSNTTIAYTEIGEPLDVVAESSYLSGVSSSGVTANATFLARISASPVSSLGGLTSVSAEISSPAVAPRDNRQIFSFTTLIANFEPATAPSPP